MDRFFTVNRSRNSAFYDLSCILNIVSYRIFYYILYNKCTIEKKRDGTDASGLISTVLNVHGNYSRSLD